MTSPQNQDGLLGLIEGMGLDAVAQLLDREEASRSLYSFVKQAWPHVVPQRRFVECWLVGCLCEHLEAVTRGQIKNLAINLPPNTAKSVITCVLWPAWEWTTSPATSFLCAAHTRDLALRDAGRMRALVESQWYRGNWESEFRLTTGQNEKARFANSKRGERTTMSPDAGVTGWKGSRLIFDDPHDSTKVESDVQRQHVIEWWGQTFYNRVLDEKTGTRVVIGQRTHPFDLFWHLLETGGFEWLILPEEFDRRRRATSIGWHDPRRTEGELLRPELFGPDQIAEAKQNLGERGYAAQHMQAPTARDGTMFRRAGFQQVVASLPERLPGTQWNFCRYWDRAATEGAGCYTAGTLMARSRSNTGACHYYVLDLVRGQWGSDERDRVMRATAESDRERFGRVRIVVEQEPGSAGKDQVLAVTRLLHGFSVERDKVTGPKEVRAEPWASAVNGGIVSLVRDSITEGPWIKAFVEEHLTFPHGRYKDQVDSAAGAFNRLARSKGAGACRLNYLGDEPVYGSDDRPVKVGTVQIARR